VRIEITDAEAGARLDKLLILKLPGLGRAAAKRLFAEGRVRIRPGGGERGHRAAKGDVASAADVIEIDLEPAEASSGATPDPDAPLQVVLETPEIILVDKHAGQPTAPLDPG
jgi:23S rRNA pseudouridine1911/1915/1917 synthase